METRRYKKLDVDLKKFSEEVAVLIPDLIDRRDYHKKIIAKNSLIDMGKSVVPQLHSILKTRNHDLRVLILKIIQNIGDEESICTFIKLIRDDDSSIRWIAAKGLVQVGRESIIPLLRVLMGKDQSHYLKPIAHYIFTNLFTPEEKIEFKALLLSLSNNHYLSFTAPIEAMKAFNRIRSKALL